MLNLTEEEILALPAVYNLCDGHAFRPWSQAETAVIGNAASLLRDADRMSQFELESEYLKHFFVLARQSREPSPIQNFLFFTASMGLEVIGNYLRLQKFSVALIEPCFDNLTDILRRHGIVLESLPEEALVSSTRTMEEYLGRVTADVIYIVSPNNPTGTSIGAEGFRTLVKFCRATKKLLILDACFRFYTPSELVYDQYAILNDADIDYIVIEDTGKTWPTLELKTPFIAVSDRLVGPITKLRSDFLLHVSPFTVRLLTEFLKLSHADGLRHVHTAVEHNRRFLMSCLQGTFLRPADTGTLSLAWLAIDAPITASELKQLLAASGVYILAGNQFFWSNPSRGDGFVRVALARAEGIFKAAAARFPEVCEAIQRNHHEESRI